jgi:hypothetical protein
MIHSYTPLCSLLGYNKLQLGKACLKVNF